MSPLPYDYTCSFGFSFFTSLDLDIWICSPSHMHTSYVLGRRKNLIFTRRPRLSPSSAICQTLLNKPFRIHYFNVSQQEKEVLSSYMLVFYANETTEWMRKQWITLWKPLSFDTHKHKFVDFSNLPIRLPRKFLSYFGDKFVPKR